MTPRAWLRTPLEDYERHVEHGSVGQAVAIRGLLAEAIAELQPRKLLYLGCAGGNGLEAAAGNPVRITGLDLNPAYVEQARLRWGHLPGSAFHVCDLNGPLPSGLGGFDLIFGALVFEYLDDPEAALIRLAEAAQPAACLIAPLLEAGPGAPAVAASPYRHLLGAVGAEFRPLARSAFADAAAAGGWELAGEALLPLPAAKAFRALRFRLR